MNARSLLPALAPNTPELDPLAAVEHAALVEEALSVIRHDLRNKLGSVRNATHYVKRRVRDAGLADKDPRLASFFGLIDDEIVAAVSILDSSVSRRFAPRSPRPIAVGECVLTAVECARVTAEDRARVVVEGRGEDAVADADELALALRCLLENAIEAGPRGEVRVTVTNEGDRLAICVCDQAGGVTADIQQRMTEPFFTTKTGRTGLGLNIAARTARRYGGALTLRATERGLAAAVSIARARAPEEAR